MKTLATVTLLIVILFFASGCWGCQRNRVTDVSALYENITYFKDPRTGIVFAAVNSDTYMGREVVSITAVPADKVPEALLSK